MKIHTVDTNGDASLVTRAGSLVDARNGGLGDDAADVLANTVDLKAVGGSVGDPSGLNDLEINSSRGAGCALAAPFNCTIAAEATVSVYLTETFGAANVVLGAAYGGDFRLTVRESALSGEDLNLLPSGATLVDETGGQPNTNFSRPVANGQIVAPNGWILLRVGDNVTTDPNSFIRAGKWIDICGDYRRTTGATNICGDFFAPEPGPSDTGDPGVGTIMHLAGEITPGTLQSRFV
jgi:hypothetical protein